MPFYTDQIARTIELSCPPKRIISLVPSQTELLQYLGLEEEVIGITKFCVHPKAWFAAKKRVGGTKNVHVEVVKSLLPDLIIAGKEENVREQIEELEKVAPVWVSDVKNLHDAFEMIQKIGILVNKESKAAELCEEIQNRFEPLRNHTSCVSSYEGEKDCTVNPQGLPAAAYLIWKDPYMAVGGDTFINDILTRCGLINLFKNTARYPQITIHQLRHLNCRLLLLSSEPYPFQQHHADELQQLLPDTKIMIVEGEMFSWYGSRLLDAATYLKTFKEGLDVLTTYSR